MGKPESVPAGYDSISTPLAPVSINTATGALLVDISGEISLPASMTLSLLGIDQTTEHANEVVVKSALPAGTNLIGKMSIDQATAHANEVVVKSPIPAGSNTIGGVCIDQAIPNGNEVVLKPASSLPAGTNLLGKVGIDQETEGANGVAVVSALPAGTNVLGGVAIDQTTPGTSNAVQVAAVAATADNTGNATHAAASVTFAAAGEGVQHVLAGVVVSLSKAPLAPVALQVLDDEAVVFDVDIIAGGPVSILFPRPIRGTVNKALTITLADGGTGCVGKVNALGYWTE